MLPHQNDTEAERLIQHSSVFRAVRSALLAIDAAAASSRLRGYAPASAHVMGVALVVASITHAAIVTLVPAMTAPAGRYAFSIGGAVIGALLVATARRSGGSAR